VAIDISVFNNNDIHDDVSYDGCPFISATENARIYNATIFNPFNWMIEGTREPMKALYDLNDTYIDSLNFHDYERMTDTAVALDYEGYAEHETYFSDDQWELNHEF